MTDLSKGFLMGALGVTVIGCVNEILLTLCELAKGPLAVRIRKFNETLGNNEGSQVQAIGFHIDQEEEEEDE